MKSNHCFCLNNDSSSNNETYQNVLFNLGVCINFVIKSSKSTANASKNFCPVFYVYTYASQIATNAFEKTKSIMLKLLMVL